MYRLYAQALGIRVDEIDIAAEGDLDARRLFAIDESVRPGFSAVRLAVTITGPETEERYQELRDAVDAHCPVLDLFKNATPVTVTVAKAERRSSWGARRLAGMAVDGGAGRDGLSLRPRLTSQASSSSSSLAAPATMKDYSVRSRPCGHSSSAWPSAGSSSAPGAALGGSSGRELASGSLPSSWECCSASRADRASPSASSWSRHSHLPCFFSGGGSWPR